ncbi:MAG: helix-turn-helix transcriptional regulator [Cyanobacteria bacterium J06639_18]
MTLGDRMTALRKKLKLSQNELGKRVSTSGDIIGRYERDEVKPSIEVASKIADELEVSLDYLMGKTDIELDKAIVNRVLEIQRLSSDDRDCILKNLDAFLRDAKTRQAYAS